MPLYSVLEQAPVRAGVGDDQSIRDARALARHVDRLGYHRLWVAEHHALGGVASSAPEILIGELAGLTRHLRVGSGAVLLPSHRPLHVAEQFRMLEALHPGRIDLGIARSEGATDPAIVEAFGRPEDNAHGAGFDAQLEQLLAFGGVRPLPADHPLAAVRAGPRDAAFPPVFLLGSSRNSALTAARLGLGYGFAAYTNPDVAADALRTYRARFVPATPGARPHAILGLKVMVGEDDEHAGALALPWHLALVRHRAAHAGPLWSVEDALAHRWSAAEREAEHLVDRRADVVAGPERAVAMIEEHVARAHADEVIVTTNTFDSADRWGSLERLALAAGRSEAGAEVGSV
jgi:luciferase family oxidoreductase group 1